MKAVAYTDGRGGCGTGACACVITLNDGTVIEEAIRLNEPTVNEAEYQGVLLAIKFALQYGVTDLSIFSDSQLISYQITGKYEAKDERLKALRNKVWEEANAFQKITINWVRREHNKRADQLCRLIDKEPSPRKNPFANRER